MDVNRKIAVVCNYALMPERVGGMDYFFWQFDRKCRQEGIAVDWFFPNASGHGDYPLLKVHSHENKNAERCFLDYLALEKTEYSHIITHFVEICTPFYRKVKSTSKARIIAIDHNPRPIGGYPLRKKIEKRIKGFLFARHIDLLAGVSEYTRKELLRDFGPALKHKTTVIYNGVLFEDIAVRTERKKQAPDFLVVSHLRESKGIQDLISAVSLLPEKIRESLRIDIYGEGSYRQTLEEMIAEKDTGGNFRFMGSRPDLKEIYRNYDYMIQPTHMECFSLSILESLAANVPVVTTDVGGNTEAVIDRQNGFIFAPKDTAALAQLIGKIFTGEIGISGNTRERIAELFTLDRMVENHFLLLKPGAL